MYVILVNAYACSPNMGSEPGMAWNWCIHLANYCELHIITEGEFRDKIEATLPTLPQSKNMHFYYNPVSEKVRKMCWNQGDWRFYKYYKDWQYETYKIALEIVASTHIDIVHQLNMIGFREPGYLWMIKDIPFIWGPVDAKDAFPLNYLENAGLKVKLFTLLKNTITRLQLRYSSRIRRVAHRAAFVVSASSNSRLTFKDYFNIDSPLINETGTFIKKLPIKNKNNKEILDILWVGKFDFRKQLGLALKSIAESNNKNLRLHIVGDSPSGYYTSLSQSLRIEEQVVWYGKVSHPDVQNLMRTCDVLLFTSVAEGTPHVVLEALSNNLPVICFDTCGQGDSVDDKCGIKIKLSRPRESIGSFAKILNTIQSNRAILESLSQGCKVRQIELSWDVKAKAMFNLYNEMLLGSHNINSIS